MSQIYFFNLLDKPIKTRDIAKIATTMSKPGRGFCFWVWVGVGAMVPGLSVVVDSAVGAAVAIGVAAGDDDSV